MKAIHLLLVGLVMLPAISCAQQATPEINNDVTQAIMNRRSVRKYQDRQVPHDTLALIAKYGINAPNGMNVQPWAVRVVESKNWIEGISAAFVKKNPDMAKRDPNFKNMFRNAPNLIVIATPKGQGQIEAGLVGENMILVAQSVGLGTCCLGGPVQFVANDPAAKPYLEQLRLPEGYEISYMIAIGYPDEQPEYKPKDESKIQFVQ